MAEQTTLNFGTQARGPVTCLGMTFEDDAARRRYFTTLLAEKLKDPEFRKIEGFPIGKDEDILALSDPPYYCACPNPWINDFISEWEAAKPPKPMGYKYEREPFAADVSEGKNDPIYNAHSYHTKVPHKAIMRYILHYTEPGDIVFDGFCGTGMTGVAAQMCGNIEQVRSLGYTVDEKTGEIRDPNGEDPKKVISHLGARKSVLNDLSPVATFIAYNYNSPVDVDDFEAEANRILKEVEDECGWMYETQHPGTTTKCKISCVIWSDVFVCPHCQEEFIYWDVALDKEHGKILDEFKCPCCHGIITKTTSKAVKVSTYDQVLSKMVSIPKRVPVLIAYEYLGKQHLKVPDEYDFNIINKIETGACPYDFPHDRMMHAPEDQEKWGNRWRAGSAAFAYVHHAYTKRNMWILAAFDERVKKSKAKFILTAIANRSTVMNRLHVKNFCFGGGGWNAGYLKGAIYVSSIPIETSIFSQWADRLSSVAKALRYLPSTHCGVIGTKSSTHKVVHDGTVDYVFIDPPFGANLDYSELSFIWESWLKVWTDNKNEIIESPFQNKTVNDYRDLMAAVFSRVYQCLKPGGWTTVEFSNTSAGVWNGIQSAMTNSGLVVATVSALDKKQGSFNAVTNPTSVKQDLVITAYKPDVNFEARFKIEGESESGVWDFVRTHLGKLPVCKVRKNRLIPIQERDPRLLYDQVISFFVRRNMNVPISAKEFQLGLAQKFSERDGLYFLPEQVVEYDKKKDKVESFVPQGDLFVCDEASAIDWLRVRLKEKPQTYASINPDFMQQLGAWSKHETLPELRLLLDENFLCYDGRGPVPSQIHGYLSNAYHDLRMLGKDDPKLIAKATDLWYVPDPNSAADMEKKREKALLKEFESYRAEKKLKKFRLEVVRAGFKKAFTEKDFATILAIGEKIPEDVINEDNKLLMWYNIAQRLGGR